MKRDKWVWMGHAGHFCLGNECRFRMSTYVGKYLVSTVGELFNSREVRMITARVRDPNWLRGNQHLKGDYFDAAYFDRFGYENIGADRKYETAVFKAKKSKNKCCPYEIIVAKEVDFAAYNSAKEAHNGHYKMCNKWSKEK